MSGWVDAAAGPLRERESGDCLQGMQVQLGAAAAPLAPPDDPHAAAMPLAPRAAAVPGGVFQQRHQPGQGRWVLTYTQAAGSPCEPR